uniref:MOSC domain-containing protein n=2 Tax=Candidatus Bipolaricaulota TaxID=67810 RepID=H5SFC5_9BACT|nr:MOSC domain-containing protein [uncultured Acetothermia bacterium]BAL57945.1 MOSC domain-containing protein [uncultured Acetothermia bacterium]BAL58559.1 MOSC domain containing protein [Candidatus Acetothermum autotrophicum]
MKDGRVVSLHMTDQAAEPMKSVNEVRAVAGRGLEGDRYFLKTGTYSSKHGPDREVTLIEIEAIEALARDYGVKLRAGDARRNIVTRGVALNHLVGKEFRLGEAVLRGIRLCEPCQHLVRLTGQEKVLAGLVHRGGLRAQIVRDGIIHVGDAVTILDT